MSDTPWTDQYTLLCEKCGYVVEGLDTADPCPECGKPIEESLPIERPGTPWQQKHSIINLLRTWYRVLRHPKRTFDEMTSIEQDGISLTAVGQCFAIAAVLAITLVLIIVSGEIEAFDVLVFLMVVGVIFWVVTYLYAWIAAYRMRVWTRNKYRIDADASWAIVGHASLGLCLPPFILFLTISFFGLALLVDYMISIDQLEVYLIPIAGLAYIANLASIPAGIVLFEILCTIGARRLKFRNRNHSLSFDDLPEPSQSDTRTT